MNAPLFVPAIAVLLVRFENAVRRAEMRATGSPDAEPYEDDYDDINFLRSAILAEHRKAVRALRDLIAAYDPELGVIDVSPDPGCSECTHGITPHKYDTGPCARHRALAALALAEKV